MGPDSNCPRGTRSNQKQASAFSRAWASITRQARRKSPMNHEDLRQDALLKLWEKREELDSSKGSIERWFGGFLDNFAYHAHRDDARRGRVIVSVEGLEELPQPGAVDSPEDLLEREEKRRRVNDAIDALEPKLAVIARDCFVHGKTHAEVAKTRGLALGTVKTRTLKAQQAIRTWLVRNGRLACFNPLFAVFFVWCGRALRRMVGAIRPRGSREQIGSGGSTSSPASAGLLLGGLWLLAPVSAMAMLEPAAPEPSEVTPSTRKSGSAHLPPDRAAPEVPDAIQTSGRLPYFIAAVPAPNAQTTKTKPAQHRPPKPKRAESALILDANASLKSGRFEEALTFVKVLETQYPSGTLIVDREWIAFNALAGLRRNAEACARGKALLANPAAARYYNEVRRRLDALN